MDPSCAWQREIIVVARDLEVVRGKKKIEKQESAHVHRGREREQRQREPPLRVHRLSLLVRNYERTDKEVVRRK